MSQDTTTEADAPKQSSHYVRIMLVVVIVLGVLLVAGAGVVISTVIKRVSNPDAIITKQGFGETTLHVPAGAQLLGVENGDTRLVLHLKDADGTFLILIDPRKGEETGRIRVRSQ